MCFVYILFSSSFNKSYVGISANVGKRLLEHNSSKSKYTSKFAPWIVIHTEEFENRVEARKREKYLKSSAGRRWMQKHIDWPHSSTG